MQADQRKISSNSYGFSPKGGGEVNAIPVTFYILFLFFNQSRFRTIRGGGMP